MKNKELKITEQNFQYILGKDYDFVIQKIIPNCYCFNCKSKYDSTIVNYEIYIDEINGIVLRGFCKDCNGKVGRSLETNEIPEQLDRTLEVRRRYEQ